VRRHAQRRRIGIVRLHRFGSMNAFPVNAVRPRRVIFVAGGGWPVQSPRIAVLISTSFADFPSKRGDRFLPALPRRLCRRVAPPNRTAALPLERRRRLRLRDAIRISRCAARRRRASTARHCRRSCASISSPPAELGVAGKSHAERAGSRRASTSRRLSSSEIRFSISDSELPRRAGSMN